MRPEVLDWMDFVYAIVTLSAGIITVSVTLLCGRLHFVRHHGVHMLRWVGKWWWQRLGAVNRFA